MPKKSDQLREAYTKDLNKRIKIPAPPKKTTILGKGKTEKERGEIYEREIAAYNSKNAGYIAKEYARKMNLFLQRFDLDVRDSDVWYHVAMNLAIDHVPGFAVEEEGKRGRKQKWNYVYHFRLYFDVVKLTKGNLKDNYIFTACHDLSKEDYWKSFVSEKLESKDIIKTLQNQFSIARKSPMVRMFEALPNDPELKQEIYEKIMEDSDLFLKEFPVK